uniref:DUF155 domain-containing protein n=1 Tax=Ditylum brightwellii TaxID=49249 RepID=A0A7S1Z1N5_9STRA|mmetsp:Transcript_22555/g.33562  ORF Transcript_22555/g.33562 Transcript_22555/m.33562 type:complete len:624 (+) Transcript_22555:188-2059(+)
MMQLSKRITSNALKRQASSIIAGTTSHSFLCSPSSYFYYSTDADDTEIEVAEIAKSLHHVGVKQPCRDYNSSPPSLPLSPFHFINCSFHPTSPSIVSPQRISYTNVAPFSSFSSPPSPSTDNGNDYGDTNNEKKKEQLLSNTANLVETLRQFGVTNTHVKDVSTSYPSSRLLVPPLPTLSPSSVRRRQQRRRIRWKRRRRSREDEEDLATAASSTSNNTIPPSFDSSSYDTPPYQHFFETRTRRSNRLRSSYPNYYNYNDTEMEEEDGEYGISARLRVRSVHAAQTIDLVAVLSKVFMGGGGGVLSFFGENATTATKTTNATNQPNATATQKKKITPSPNGSNVVSTPPLRHVFGRTSLIVQLPPLSTPQNSAVLRDKNSQLEPYRYVAIFRFGSVVFFNVSSKEAGKILEEIKKHGTDPISPGFERRENFEVAIKPGMQEKNAYVNGDFATVKELDMNSVAVISTIMGQTVALDSYNTLVDELLANFAIINSSVKQTGNFTVMEKEKLFKVVAQNNSLFIDMISKLGIKDRSDTAWNLSQYERIHEGMKEEFEIEDRFEHIEFKLNLIQQNAKFFLEVLHAQKTNSLEWIIIVLISFECSLMCLEMSGLGGTFFQAILPYST